MPPGRGRTSDKVGVRLKVLAEQAQQRLQALRSTQAALRLDLPACSSR